MTTVMLPSQKRAPLRVKRISSSSSVLCMMKDDEPARVTCDCSCSAGCCAPRARTGVRAPPGTSGSASKYLRCVTSWK